MRRTYRTLNDYEMQHNAEVGLFTRPSDMAKKKKKRDALTELLEVASHNVLSDLILELTTEFPEVRRGCFDFLKSQATISKSLEKRSEGEAIMALRSDLAPDLEDLDSYGGGD